MSFRLPPRLWPSAYYFIYFSAYAALSPFQALYFQSRGLSGGQIGLLLGMTPLIMVLAAPLWTGLADLTRRHRTVLLATLVGAAALAAAIPTIRPTAWLFLTVALFAFFAAPLSPMADSATLSMLGGDGNKYGRVRIWGTLGWGLAGPLVGALMQSQGLSWSYWIYAAGLCLLLLPGSRLTFSQARSGAPFLQGMRRLLADRRWLLFLFLAVAGGISFAANGIYMGILMNDVGGTSTLVGVALFVATVSELPMMFFSHRLLERLKPRGLFILAVAIGAARCLLYVFVHAPAGIIAVQLLHGMTSPALLVAGVNYAAVNAPPGLEATAQGVFSAVLLGLGGTLGNLTGGVLIGRFGPEGMYGIVAVITFACLVIFLLAERLVLPRPVSAPTP